MAIYMDKLDQFKKMIAGLLESIEILPKCQKLSNFFICDFYQVFSCYYAIRATIGFSRPQTPDFQR